MKKLTMTSLTERLGLSINGEIAKQAEHSLMLSVIIRAITDYCQQAKEITESQQMDAEEWLFCGDTCAWSFLWLCEHTDMDPFKILDKLLTAERSKLGKQAAKYRFKKSPHNFKI